MVAPTQPEFRVDWVLSALEELDVRYPAPGHVVTLERMMSGNWVCRVRRQEKRARRGESKRWEPIARWSAATIVEALVGALEGRNGPNPEV